MRKPAFCICKNKDTDQLRSNREADQRLCFRYIDSTIPLVPKLYTKFRASIHLVWLYSLLYSLVFVGPGRKPRRPVFSQRGSNDIYYLYLFVISESLHNSSFFLRNAIEIFLGIVILWPISNCIAYQKHSQQFQRMVKC